MAASEPHIGIVGISDFANIVDEFCANIESDTLVFERRQRDDPIVNFSFETIDSETLVVIYFLAKFGAELATEIGKGVISGVLTGALMTFTKRLFHREKDTSIVTLRDSTRPPLYSVLFSMCANIDGCSVKFVFRTQCSEEEYAATGQAVLIFLETHYSGKTLEKYQPIVTAANGRKHIVVAYDYSSDSLYVV